MLHRVAVLGSGNGGQACAADQALRGFDVRLYEDPKFSSNLKPILEKGGVEVSGEGANGLARLSLVTSDIREVVKGAELIQIVSPAYAHKALFEACAPYLEEGQTVVFYGKGGATLEILEIFRQRAATKRILLGESTSLPFACRIVGPAKVEIYEPPALTIASLPSVKTPELLAKLRELYPMAVAATNVFETMFNDINAVVHPATVILNAGRIEYSKGEFFFYKEGITPEVCIVIEQVDAERCGILRSLNLKSNSLRDKLSKKDSRNYDSLYDAIRISWSSLQTIKGPNNLHDRYLIEDVPFGLVSLVSFGDPLKVDTPVSRSLVTLASVLHKTDYMKTGRTVENLGLSGLGKRDMINFVETFNA